MTSKTTAKDASDAKRWLIIGAHQAGASEKRVARISGLSKTAVRHIILNYQRTGNPCLPKREPKKVKDKLLVEYDENGNLILSDDEDDAPAPVKKENGIKKAQPNGKRSSKLNSKVTAKDLIEYMMEQVKRAENDYIPKDGYHEPYYDHEQYHRSTWCPTPPRDGSSDNQLPIPDSPSFLPLSPPASRTSKEHPHESSYSPLPSPSKYDQTIRGYELWTHKDDMVLLQHVLCRLQLGNWRELEAKFQGRHTARLCIARWNYLRDHLLKGIAKADSSPW